MKKDEKLLFFLGKTKALIENLSCDSLAENSEKLFEKIADLEQYFNEEIATIFGEISEDFELEKPKELRNLGLMLWG